MMNWYKVEKGVAILLVDPVEVDWLNSVLVAAWTRQEALALASEFDRNRLAPDNISLENGAVVVALVSSWDPVCPCSPEDHDGLETSPEIIAAIEEMAPGCAACGGDSLSQADPAYVVWSDPTQEEYVSVVRRAWAAADKNEETLVWGDEITRPGFAPGVRLDDSDRETLRDESGKDPERSRLRKVANGYLVMRADKELGRVEKRVINEHPRSEVWKSHPWRGTAEIGTHKTRGAAVQRLEFMA